MDSLTQVVLGAAVGEAVLGKKLGNRAILWGALAGTIPDLDVLAGLFMDEIGSLSFHRGFTHSLLFCAIAPFLLSWLARFYYSSGWYDHPVYKWIMSAVLLLLWTGIATGMVASSPGWMSGLFLAISVAGAFFTLRYLRRSYISRVQWAEEIPASRWYLLFFLGLLTHTLLDCFTTYGTQLFQPFSNARVAWDTVNVVDPFYTIPFLICLIVAAAYRRTAPARSRWNTAGLLVSSGYLLLCVYHKHLATRQFESALQRQQIEATRIMTTPTVFNNILWYCLAETEDGFYYGYYSLFDEEPFAAPMPFIARQEDKIAPISESRAIRTLRWFSDGYFRVDDAGRGAWSWVDLRFGNFDFAGQGTQDFVFRFHLEQAPGGLLSVTQERDTPGNPSELFSQFWQRLLGNTPVAPLAQ